ncbi:M4 family metallopeptidase [bacterium]|nr:M4 family metallopeptidase [bacterium]
MFRSLVILGFLFFSLSSKGQGDRVSYFNKYNKNKLFEVAAKHVSKSQFFETYKSELGISEYTSFRKVKSFKSKSNFTTVKYKQYFRDLEVVGGNYTLHLLGDKTQKASGNLLPFVNVSTTPSLSFDEVKTHISSQLEQSMNELGYWLKLSEIKVHYYNKGLKVIDAAYPDFSGEYQLAYNVEAVSYDDSPFNENVFISAHTGKLINHFSNIHVHNSPGVVKTRYYGEQNVTIDSLASDEYYLRDFSRGDGVITLDGDLDVYQNNSKYWDLENENQDEVAGDLHYCASSFYDMMNDHFDWSGIDGEGGELITVAHAGGKFLVNAYWDGVRARFGNGDCDRYSPLTTLDIVGHEFAHGLTDYTSDLVYRNESGALNESMSDIFGKALEYYYDNANFNWLIGDRIRLNEDINVIRSMEDPTVRNDAKFYKGDFWWTSTGDNGGVHSNSGVLNHWFYLLVNGEQGINEIGESYNISAVSFDDAMQIVFNMQRVYLTENSNYYDALMAAVESAKDLYGENSTQHLSVVEAWNAVGLKSSDNSLSLDLVLDYEFIAACPGEVVYPSFIMINTGRETIPSGINLISKFISNNDIDNFSDTILLDKDMMVGDSLLHTFSSQLTNEISNNGTFFINVAMASSPNDLINESRGAFGTSDVNGADILLDNVEIFKRNTCEPGELDAFRYRIKNTGCRNILVSDSIFFDVETNVGDFTVGIRVFFDFEPGDITSSTRTLRFATDDEVPDGIETFDVKVRHEDDVVAENNSFSGEVVPINFISDGYIETFSDINSDKSYSISKNDFYTHDTIVSYRNNEMLGIFGLRDHNFFRNCEKEEDFFSEYFFKAEIDYCVDASEIEEPIFEFNAMMFDHEASTVELINEDYSTMIQVEYEDGTGDLISGQPQGSLINHKLQLPPNYVGELNITVLALSQNETEQLDFTEDKDLVLLDDIKLYDKTKYNPNTFEGGYSIFPNPTTDIVRIANADNNKLFDVDIFNAIGQRVYEQKSILNQDWIDLSYLPEGVYFVRLVESGEIISSTKIIKLD